jgi:hypothetical protein
LDVVLQQRLFDHQEILVPTDGRGGRTSASTRPTSRQHHH